MLSPTQLISQLRADTQVKQELIRRTIAEPAVIEEPPPVIRHERDDALWRPIDPQVHKALAYARKRMKRYARELARKRR